MSFSALIFTGSVILLGVVSSGFSVSLGLPFDWVGPYLNAVVPSWTVILFLLLFF